MTAVNIFTSDDRPATLKAKTYVLATGGIENSRILLWSNELSGGELIKNTKALGKYWMDHPHFIAGDAILSGDPAVEITQNGYLFLSPSSITMRENNVLNCGLRVELANMQTAEVIISKLACVAPRIAAKTADLLRDGLAHCAILRAVWEQEPQESNRIELSGELDRFGVPKVRLYWTKSETDLRTPRVTVEALARYCAVENIGRIRIDDWVFGESDYPTDDWLAGSHHMGGTRMASTMKNGVVDENCKVFGQDNLYIAGSSVFPSSGYANPTLTIIQITLRLGDHLANNNLTATTGPA